jgi:hypothetical protein
MAATIFSVSGANWVSTIKMPSGPESTPMVPPCPSSVEKLLVILVVLISTLLKSCCAWAWTPMAIRAKAASSAGAQRIAVFLIFVAPSYSTQGIGLFYTRGAFVWAMVALWFQR